MKANRRRFSGGRITCTCSVPGARVTSRISCMWSGPLRHSDPGRDWAIPASALKAIPGTAHSRPGSCRFRNRGPLPGGDEVGSLVPKAFDE
jgi:hypothetical protein